MSADETITRNDLFQLWNDAAAAFPEDGKATILERFVRLLGYTVVAEKPPEPELPEGWEVHSISELSGGWKEGFRSWLGFPDDCTLFFHGNADSLRSQLSRALAALRQPEGEVEDMVPLAEFIDEPRKHGLPYPPGVRWCMDRAVPAVRVKR